jgi:hypothetical protein
MQALCLLLQQLLALMMLPAMGSFLAWLMGIQERWQRMLLLLLLQVVLLPVGFQVVQFLISVKIVSAVRLCGR